MKYQLENMESIRSNFSSQKWVCLVMCALLSFFAANGQQKEIHQKTVVIDAGHGGKDPGTVVGLAKEKNVVLDIALKLGKLIKQSQKNVKVVFIRDGDYFVPLMDRAQIANKIKADLFISIHANYCENPEINGTETYVLGLHRTEDNLNVAKKENSVILLEDDYSKRYEGFNPNLSESYIMFELVQDAFLDQSVRFATILQSNFKELAQRHDREVRQAGFLVLRETAMPSVLIETGYLSNKKENSYLLTDTGRSEIAQSIYGSLLNYLNKLDAKDILPVKSEKEAVSGNLHPQKLKTPKPKTKPPSEFVSTRDETTLPVVIQTKPDNKPMNKVPKSENNKSESKVIKEEVKPSVDKTQKSEAKIPEPINSEASKTYAIQIGVYNRKIAPDSKIFKGISSVKELIIDGKYKYFCFESDTFQKTKENFSEVIKNFPDAFIVSIQNNQTKMVWKGSEKK
jgi:N-acetylmuramoyl-L-alanine amidase